MPAPRDQKSFKPASRVAAALCVPTAPPRLYLLGTRRRRAPVYFVAYCLLNRTFSRQTSKPVPESWREIGIVPRAEVCMRDGDTPVFLCENRDLDRVSEIVASRPRRAR